MNDFKYAVNTNRLKDMNYGDIAKLCARLGFDGIEWGLRDDDLNKSAVKEMDRVTLGEGLEVAAYINAGHLWKKDVMRQYSDLVAAANGRMLRVAHPWLAYNFDESLHQRESFMDLFQRARDGLEMLQDFSKEYGIRYVLEMHGGSLCASAPACRRLMDGLDPQAVGVIFDPANGILEGFLRPRHSAEALGPYLAYVHAKNLMLFYAGELLDKGPKRAAWDRRTTSLDGGMIDYVEVFFALKCVGFGGWISAEEFFTSETAEQDLPRGLAFLKECEAAAPPGPQAPYTTFND